MKRVLGCFLSFALVLTLGVSALATQADDSQRSPETKSASGKVTKVDAKSITIEMRPTSGEAAETMEFVINEDTKKPADLATGSEVTIHYRDQAGVKTATAISVKTAPVKP